MENEIIEQQIPINEIYLDDDFNSRGAITPFSVASLADSITELGLLNAITIQPFDKVPGKKYRVVAGHRRLMAMKRLGKETIRSVIREGLSEIDARRINLSENIKRSDLTILQEAKALEPFVDAGWSRERICEELGVSSGWLHIRFCLLDLDPQIQEVAHAGLLTQNQIKDLYSMNKGDQFKAVKLIKEKRERNEKVPVIKKKESNPLKKRQRSKEEIFDLMDIVYKVFKAEDRVGAYFATRCMSWAAGEISDVEVHRDIAEEAEKIGKRYFIPVEIREAIE